MAGSAESLSELVRLDDDESEADGKLRVKFTEYAKGHVRLI